MNELSMRHVSATTTPVGLDASGRSANLAVCEFCNCSLSFQDIEKFIEVVTIHVPMLRKRGSDGLPNFPNTCSKKNDRSNQEGFVEGLQIQLRDHVPEVIQGLPIKRPDALRELIDPLPAGKLVGNGGQDGFCDQRDISRNICSPTSSFAGFSGLNVERQARACENSQRCGDGLYPTRDVTTAGRSELCIVDSQRHSTNCGKCGQCSSEDKPQKNAYWLGVLHGCSLRSKPTSYSDEQRAVGS